jgi:predicted O-methyltransferase YrrM
MTDMDTMGWTSYIDTKTRVEHERLMLMERLFDPYTERLLDRFGVPAGASCLEVGAGAGSVARLLAARAGAANVTATDMSTEFLAPLAETGIRVLHHDVVADEQPGEFDVIHSRFVLEHVTGRQEAIGRMASWLRPGGWLLIESATPMPGQSSDPTVARALSALVTQFAASVGTEPGFATTLPVPLEEVGLVSCGAEGTTLPVRGGSDYARWLTHAHKLIEQPAIEGGVISEEELAEAYAIYATPGFVDYTWMTVAAWGQRPPA